ncbi:FAD binding domain-containing protein [Pseudonocardia sp. H11422]|uniref:FAD binding domain-containing protein n=1 Tax=Pseudonocardia sp. H11422 TaxID=2835866 RepID=UPI001BDCE8DC|nr:xanthine dehydrogenase family protein subunit M [Pseudonocardia sp. H11422]
MKPASFKYACPTTVAEAVGLLQHFGDDAKVLAGGQSLVPMMNGRLAQPDVLIDINQIAELRALQVNGGLRIGAGVRQRTALESFDVQRVAPVIAEALRHVGHVGIRARGTVGGSIAHADPAAELPTIMLALDATMTVTGAGGQRTVPAEEFFRGVFTTAVEYDELLTDVHVPVPGPASRSAFVEVSRRRGDFALVGAAVSLELIDGAARRVRIALSGVADRPVLAHRAQEFLEGKDPHDPVVLEEAGRLGAADLDPAGDIHAPGSYRKKVSAVLVKRALSNAVNGE